MFARTSAALFAALLIAPVVTAQSIDWDDPESRREYPPQYNLLDGHFRETIS